MRVLAVTNMYPSLDDPSYGGFVASQMSSVASAGAQVDVCFIDGRRSMLAYASAPYTVRKRTRRDSFDVIHAHYGLTGFVASLEHLPMVVSFCGDDLLGTPTGRGGDTLKSRLIVRLSRVAAQRADAIICKSEGLRDALPSEADRVRAKVIGNGVDTQKFCPGDRVVARRKLGVAEDETLILFPHSRNQAAVKRFDLAEAAVGSLAGKGLVGRLWVINGVKPQDMPDYYRAANCFLLTSDHEGSPNSVKEALCCDLPVVSVDAGDAKDWIALAPGCVVVDRHPDAIARGLQQTLRNGQSIDGSQVRQKLDARTVALEVIRTYEDAIRVYHDKHPARTD
jgi:teichuronic acid biosynthesis glycosyltransferase TuaC